LSLKKTKIHFLFQPLTELGALVVGNPKLPSGIMEQWGWNNLPLAEQEAAMVSELLSTSSSPAMAPSGRNATKQAVLARIATADCIHFSTHVAAVRHHPCTTTIPNSMRKNQPP
jgi:hypothetical protein